MYEEVYIKLIANAGVMIKYKGVKILIDGIHDDTENNFSKLPKQILDDILNGNGELQDIDFIMFSHVHSDHLSPEYTLKYLKNNDVDCIFIPDCNSSGYLELQDYLVTNSINYELIKIPKGNSRCFNLKNGISVTVFGTPHMGKQYSSVEHYCFLLTLDERNILFASDADYIDSYFEYQLLDIKVDTVFVNPLFFNNKVGRTLLSNVIKPKNVGVYHIPFPQDDKWNLRRLVERDLNKCRNESFKSFDFWDENQVVIL